MNTSEILTEFIEDTGKTVSDRTLNKYKDAIDLFALFLRDTRYDENEDLEYDVKEEQKRVLAALDFDFSEVTSEAIEQFLGYFLIRKVMDTISFKDDVSKRMHKFVKWAYQKGYMSKENYEDCEPMVKRLKTDVRLAEELFFVLADYVDEDQPENCEEESYEDYFQIKKVTPGKLYLESIYPFGDELDEEIIVKVPEKISSMCKADWQICMEIAKCGPEWKILMSGSVYPIPY